MTTLHVLLAAAEAMPAPRDAKDHCFYPAAAPGRNRSLARESSTQAYFNKLYTSLSSPGWSTMNANPPAHSLLLAPEVESLSLMDRKCAPAPDK